MNSIQLTLAESGEKCEDCSKVPVTEWSAYSCRTCCRDDLAQRQGKRVPS